MSGFGQYGQPGAEGYGAGGGGAFSQQSGAMKHKSMGAKDPLFERGNRNGMKNQVNKANARPPRSQRVFQLTALSLAPFCVYVLILFLTVYMFYSNPMSVILAFTVVAGLCGMWYLSVEYCMKKKATKWKKYVGAFSALAACAALIVGVCIHYKWMLFYAKYTHMMRYTNVAPAQPALQFEDAGSLHFTSGTTIDRTRAVGFRHIRTSKTLCVAPIVSGQMTPTDEIVFFAVGVNCCGWRASFHCDDSGESARGGLLMLEPDQLVSPAMEWMVDEQFDFKSFEDAIDLQKAVFAVSVAKHHRMMRWVKDPDAEIDHFRKRGLEAALISCAGYWVLVGLAIANHVAVEEKSAKKRADALMKGESLVDA